MGGKLGITRDGGRNICDRMLNMPAKSHNLWHFQLVSGQQRDTLVYAPIMHFLNCLRAQIFPGKTIWRGSSDADSASLRLTDIRRLAVATPDLMDRSQFDPSPILFPNSSLLFWAPYFLVGRNSKYVIGPERFHGQVWFWVPKTSDWGVRFS